MEAKIVEETCCKCHVLFWITAKHQSQLMKCKNIFYCPNGHPQSYTGETEEIKRKRAERLLDNAQRSKDALMRSNSALRGVVTRMKNREEQE